MSLNSTSGLFYSRNKISQDILNIYIYIYGIDKFVDIKISNDILKNLNVTLYSKNKQCSCFIVL